VKGLRVLKVVMILLFFVLVAGDYFSLFEDQQLTEGITLFETRHYLVFAYILIRVYEYLKIKKGKQHGKT
jgi:hypothetical protein